MSQDLERNPNWKGGAAKYGARHARVYSHRGTARAFMCEENCGARAEEWAWVHDTDPGSPDNYRALCRACHARYDAGTARFQRGERCAKAKLTAGQARAIFAAFHMPATVHTTKAFLARVYGVSEAAIYSIVNRLSWRHATEDQAAAQAQHAVDYILGVTFEDETAPEEAPQS